MRYFFVGGIFAETKKDFFYANSKGGMQNAADAFQKKIIGSLNSCDVYPLILNFPFVGSYPVRFQRARIPEEDYQHERNRVLGVRFLNVSGYKYVSRLFGALRVFIRFNSDKSVFLIYSAHSPFLIAALLLRVLDKDFKFFIFVPDLPEYMSERSGIFRKMVTGFNSFVLGKAVKAASGVVGLTQYLRSRLGVEENRYLTWEGCADMAFESTYKSHSVSNIELPDKFIFYSGGLYKRYGLEILVKSFLKLGHPEYYLVLCGSGELENWIKGLENELSNKIIFLGQVPREDALSIQKAASLLVNPRPPYDEFTKYSFPSKTLEYMSSGRPVLMFKLSGVPEEYFEYVFSPKNNDEESFFREMLHIVELDEFELDGIGRKAREFIVNNKAPHKQGEVLLKFFNGLVGNDN